MKNLQDLIDKSVIDTKVLTYKFSTIRIDEQEIPFVYYFGNKKKQKISNKIHEMSQEFLKIKTINGTKIKVGGAFNIFYRNS
jgi:hypothetical protein